MSDLKATIMRNKGILIAVGVVLLLIVGAIIGASN